MNSNSIEITWLEDNYRVTKYFGSEVIRIEQLTERRFKKATYKTIYFGHINPLEMMVDFFNRPAPTSNKRGQE